MCASVSPLVCLFVCLFVVLQYISRWLIHECCSLFVCWFLFPVLFFFQEEGGGGREGVVVICLSAGLFLYTCTCVTICSSVDLCLLVWTYFVHTDWLVHGHYLLCVCSALTMLHVVTWSPLQPCTASTHTWHLHTSHAKPTQTQVSHR